MKDDASASGAPPSLYPNNPPINLPTDSSYRHPSNLWVFEGLDGSGKSTIVRRLVEECQARGRKARRLKLNGSELVHNGLELAKAQNVDPLTFNLLNWVSLAHQTTTLHGAFGGAELLFFDRYSLTVKTRGILEGLGTGFMAEIEAHLSRPAGIFLIDCEPEACLQRIMSAGRRISYYESGVRDVNGVGAPMQEADASVRSPDADRQQGLLKHLRRMREVYRSLALEYDNLHVIRNDGRIEDAIGEVLSILGLQPG